jgi:hypothetical protein
LPPLPNHVTYEKGVSYYKRSERSMKVRFFRKYMA